MTDHRATNVKEKWRWTAFWQRLKQRALVTQDYDALTWRVLIPFLSPSLFAGLFLNSEGAAGDWALKMAKIWMAPFVMAVFCLLSYCTKPRSQSVFRKIWGIVAPLGLGFLFAYGTIGYFDFGNALTGSREPVAVHGPVVRKGYSTGRITGLNAYLTFRYEGRDIHLLVTTKEYDRHDIGDDYGQVMYRGGFGYFYRWERFVSWK